MEPLDDHPYLDPMTEIHTNSRTVHHPDASAIRATIAKRSFCNLATVSAAGHPHVAGVVYSCVDDALYISTERSSRKGRNLTANPRVGVTIPVRRLPIGPPSNIQFQARAEILDLDDPEIERLAGEGRIDGITGHGELELPDGCFLRIPLPSRLHSFGLGMNLWTFVRDPFDAAGVVELH
jgi:hypothetical protein